MKAILSGLTVERVAVNLMKGSGQNLQIQFMRATGAYE